MSALLESLLDAERRAECEKHDKVERIAVQPHYWPQVPFRTDRVQHQPRRERRDSRFGDLTR